MLGFGVFRIALLMGRRRLALGKFGVRPTRRWRKPDSNHPSRVTRPSFRRRLTSPPFVPPSSVANAQNSLSQERDRWFESGSLQRRVRKPSVPQRRSEISAARATSRRCADGSGNRVASAERRQYLLRHPLELTFLVVSGDPEQDRRRCGCSPSRSNNICKIKS